MSDPDHLLTELWASDEPPERDARFVLSVMEAVERRRFRYGVGMLVLIAAGASAVLWALAPLIEAALTPLLAAAGGPAFAELVAAVAMAVFLWSWVSEGLEPRSS